MSDIDDLFATSDEEVPSQQEELELPKTGGEAELLDKLTVMQNQIAALAQVASLQGTVQRAPSQLSAPTSNQDVEQTAEMVLILKFITKVKEEGCCFTHRSTQVNHKMWLCTLPQLQKIEELTKMIRCRICWQKGHTAMDCVIRITPVCDYCNKTGHWQPFCGAYISKAYNERVKTPEPSAAAVSSADKETIEQYDSRVTNQAIHAARKERADLELAQHFSLVSGTPIGAAPQLVPNKIN
jgi:hypothetical protein